MAGTFKFHSKYHRSSHHTLAVPSVPDSGLDPIASQQLPFLGLFYTTLTDSLRTFNINTNSLEWWSAFNTISTMSGYWAPSLSLYTTVNSLSNNWNLGYVGFTVFSANSGDYESVYTTIQTYSAEWNNPYVMYKNQAQESTASKTFSGTNLTVTTAPSTVAWNLNYNQVTFLTMVSSYFLSNPTDMRRGGNYILSIKQTGTGGKDLIFDTAYRFNGTPLLQGVINTAASGRSVITFISDGTLMFGDITNYLE